MATTELEELLVRIDATTEGLRREMRRGEQAVTKSSQRMGIRLASLEKSFFSVNRALAPLGLAATVGFGAMTAGIRNVVQQNAQLQNTADKLGVNVERLQELRFAGELVGVSTNTVDMAYQRFSRRVAEAQAGQGELLQTLKDYNIELQNSDGSMRTVEAIFRDLANAIQGAETDQERLRVAFKAFDSEGVAFVNVLRDGAAGLDEFAQNARDAGAVIDEELTKVAQELDVKWTKLTTKIRGFFTSTILAGFKLFEQDLEELNRDLQFSLELLSELENIKGVKTLAQTEQIRELRREIELLRNMIRLAEGKGERVGVDIGGGGGATSAPNADETRLKNRVKSTQLEIDALNKIAAAYRISAEAGADMTRQMEAQRALRNSNAELMTGPEAEALRQNILAQKTLADQIKQQSQAYKEQEQAVTELSDTIETELFGAVESLASGYGDLRTVAVRALSAIIKKVIELDIANQKLTSAGGGGGGSFFSTILGGVLGFFGGGGAVASQASYARGVAAGGLSTYGARGNAQFGFAEGGRPPVGVPSLVGERGPEMFVPDRPGTIVPNHQMGGTYYIDARGADAGGLARLERMIVQLNGSVEKRAVTAVVDARQRTPRLFAR